jgi:hypothetical protein
MIHQHTELRFVSDAIGYGVFATDDIPKGTITWVKDQLDRVVKKEDLKNLSEPNLDNLLKYTYRDRNGDFVFCWDLTRFINHSFVPNTMATSLNFEIAIKDICKGEEITNDYGTLNITEPFYCKRPTISREVVRPDDLKYFFQEWDLQIEEASKYLFYVDQPLEKFLSIDQKRQLQQIKNGELKFPSILNNLFIS